MKFRSLLLISLLIGRVLPALGDCDGKRSALSDFGLVSLGDRADALPVSVMPLPNCGIYRGKYVDCELIDKSGVSYLAYENVINRKDILIHRSSHPPLLPFGLKPTDKVSDVVKKITARNDAPDFYIRYENGKLQIFSDACVTNERGENFIVEFEFRSDETFEKMSALTGLAN